MESVPQQRNVAQPSSSTRSPRFFPNSASTQRPLRLFTLSLEGSVILCSKGTKTATLTTFRINTCKSVSKQRTLTPFRMNTYKKTGGGGTPVFATQGNARRMRHVAPLSPVPSLDCAYFLSPRGCGALCAFLATRLPRARLCVGPLATSLLFSSACGLFISLCALFPAPILCFQQLAHSFVKTPGVVGVGALRPLPPLPPLPPLLPLLPFHQC